MNVYTLTWDKSPAPLVIRMHLITCKQKKMKTINVNTDFPNHQFLPLLKDNFSVCPN